MGKWHSRYGRGGGSDGGGGGGGGIVGGVDALAPLDPKGPAIARTDLWAPNNNADANGKTHNGAATTTTTANGHAAKCDDVDVDDIKCGIGPCAPRWMQVFASKQAFLVTFCVTWVLQGMYYTYFVSVITTIEKLFQIQSKTTGIIMSATEIGQIGSSLLLTYYGGQGHRPKWIAWGMVLFAVSSFTCSLPHFLFGKQLIEANDRHFGGVASMGHGPFHAQQDNVTTADDDYLPNICRAPGVNLNLNLTWTAANETAPCESEKRIQSKHTTIVLAIFFASLLGVGMGQTAVYTLGIPYIDDNVASRESPLYFGKAQPSSQIPRALL